MKLQMMRLKRTSQRPDKDESSKPKRRKSINNDDNFKITLQECGILINQAPEKCVASHETVIIIQNLNKHLRKHTDYPNNVSEFLSDFQKRCNELAEFKHYLFPNIVITTPGSPAEQTVTVSDSLVKILLSVPILQDKLIEFIFEKAIDLAAESQGGPWIQMILRCFSSLDNIVDSKKILANLFNLFDVATENIVHLEIITAIPDIIGDQVHENIAEEMSRILIEKHSLIPAILDCLSYLNLSNKQYEMLQEKFLSILRTISECNHFPNFVKFLLMPGRTNENTYFAAVTGLRNALCWLPSVDKPEDTASSQILTATAIRKSIISSKLIGNAWFKAISMSKFNTDHKPIDFIIILILYSVSEGKQKQLKNLIQKQIKNNIIDEECLNEAFKNFKPIIKEYFKYLISLTNSLLKLEGEPLIHNFASHIYTLLFSELEDFCQAIVAELLQLGLDSKQCFTNILSILNKISLKDKSILKPQSVLMLPLLDIDDITISELRAVMDLVCGLAYSVDNSPIRDDIQMIITKELGSSNPTTKMRGVLAGIHAVKYLMASKDGEDLPIDADGLMEGDLSDAAQLIELISHNTRQLPNMIAFFNDEFCKIIQSSNFINKHFLNWITNAVTDVLEQNFIVNSIKNEVVEDLKLNLQYCLNTDSEIDEVIAINIGGATLENREDTNIVILSSLFQLVQTLHLKKYNGNLSQVDALLGCPVVMPTFDINLIDEMSKDTISHILDCNVHCVNWFREIVNAFASQNETDLKSKIFSRIADIHKIEDLIEQILLKIDFTYKLPTQMSVLKCDRIDQFVKSNTKALNAKHKNPKKAIPDDSFLPETKTQQSHTNSIAVKNKTGIVHNITFRPLSLNILNLLNNVLIEDNEAGLSMENLPFLLKCLNFNLENMLISRIKRKTFLSKQNLQETYDAAKAEKCAKSVNDILPKIINHMKFITTHLDQYLNCNDNDEEPYLLNDKTLKYVVSLEYILNMFTTYFKWIGFKSHHKNLLEASLSSIAVPDNKKETSKFLHNLLISTAKYFQSHEKYCIQLSTAVSLIDLISALKEHSSNSSMTKILKTIAYQFLSCEWKTEKGVAEKGSVFNQNIDNLANVYFKNTEISDLKNNILLIKDKQLMDRNSTLDPFKSINNGNYHILYRNLGSALHESTKMHLNKGLTNLEHLDLWKDIILILKYMSEVASTNKSRNILIIFFKKSVPIIKLFLSQGIPIMELEFHKRKQEIINILKILQQSTRFLQILCRHFRLKKDKAIITQVPSLKELLEKLVYKVKDMLAANDCIQAFDVGVLKNKNINGEIIATPQSSQEESVECSDGQLTDNSDDLSNEDLNPDSKSASECV